MVIPRPVPSWLGDATRARLRTIAENYLQVLLGSFGRLGLQAVYFFVLANALSIHDMGVFASAAAAGIMMSCFSGFGFSGFAFRAAAGNRPLLGRYMALFYGGWAMGIPLGLIVALPIYYTVFANSIPLLPFLAIILVETAVWRIIEVVHQVNNGLGRYKDASLAIMLATAARALGALAFAFTGGGDEVRWAYIYLTANTIAMLLVYGLYRPRVRLVWRMRLFKARLKDSILFALSTFTLNAQSEIDKVLMLWLADERAAGIYAISTRLLDFTTVPFRTFYVLYSRKLIGEGKVINLLRRGLRVETVIAVMATLAVIGLVVVMWWWPMILGRNVGTAMQMFAMMLLVPAFKNLLEFHSELFFAYQRMAERALLSTALMILKAAGLVAILVVAASPAQIGLWMNLLYACLYVVSALTVYRVVASGRTV